ncbi:hypothetical protein TREMEDRAFT_26656 [Tremella mesenterica DSM 1558]|uniref:uncharacterized protein n=1 Tax=Tremella mesenterica (strain ATCC 24925 / CBS 8224 / DSM 1558 / NBRC 9311 / NRRL Y-6157 / RJB 2259-6 / UBC 559-6) TaxID=578456 RepID=UPI0003F48EE6|nr:uncharacterized protein TREMEDRAFT_26656 [Tremella mesenterica DSM 1558]EIW72836.1 hypothetical protein TREMEDRAFT_26656 [Tremella mesenterica DSM 1558]
MDQEQDNKGESSSVSLKRRRITRACDRCHRGGIKCAPSASSSSCAPCAAFGTPCTYDRPVKRRGPPARSTDRGGSGERYGSHSLGYRSDEASGSWVYHELAPPSIVERLVEAFHSISYPIHPYFHWPTFWRRVRRQQYKHDRAFYAVVYGMCAMTLARLRDGASMPTAQALTPEDVHDGPSSEDFYHASLQAMPSDLTLCTDFNFKRAKAVQAVITIQYGQVRALLGHLGDYTTMVSVDGFHNEARWPQNLTEPEIQERRRLFWSLYQLDVYSAITWGGMVRQRESQCNVLYPAEVFDDTDITEEGITLHSPHPGAVPFLKGWNFVVDLYRILEHAVGQLRSRQMYSPDDPLTPVTALFSTQTGPAPSEVLDLVSRLYSKLPPVFKGANAMTGNLIDDRFGFQSANIIITMQTVKMVLAGTEDSSVQQRCAIAGDLLDALASVPTAYIQTCSAPMLQHLAGVGHLLGSVIQRPLSQWTYLQVRNVLLAMADLLTTLESSLSQAAGLAQKLKSHVSRIDQYMTTAAFQHSQQSQVYHSALPRDIWSGSEQTTRSTVSLID